MCANVCEQYYVLVPINFSTILNYDGMLVCRCRRCHRCHRCRRWATSLRLRLRRCCHCRGNLLGCSWCVHRLVNWTKTNAQNWPKDEDCSTRTNPPMVQVCVEVVWVLEYFFFCCLVSRQHCFLLVSFLKEHRSPLSTNCGKLFPNGYHRLDHECPC